MRGPFLLLTASLSVLAACSSEPRRDHPGHVDVAPVTTEDDTKRTDAAIPEPPPSGRSSEPHELSHGRPHPAQTPSGPRDVRAERERVIEDAAAADRPSGGAEARIEPDGVEYRPGVGFMPRYVVRTVDRRDGPPPDSSVMKMVPGNNIELPPPAPKPPEQIPGKEEPGQSILVPREAK